MVIIVFRAVLTEPGFSVCLRQYQLFSKSDHRSARRWLFILANAMLLGERIRIQSCRGEPP